MSIEVRSLGDFQLGHLGVASGRHVMEDRTWDIPIADTVRNWGRVKTTCFIRSLSGYSGRYLELKEKAQRFSDYLGPIKLKEYVDHFDAVRSGIGWLQDKLYDEIDAWFKGDEGREGSVPGGVCRGMKIEIENQPDEELDAWWIPGVTVAGVGVAYLWIKADYAKWIAALDFCGKSNSPEKCKLAMENASRGGPGDTLSSALKPIIYVAGAGVAVYVGYRVFEAIMERRAARRPQEV